MRVWTVQDKAAYDDLCEKGVLRCDPTSAELLTMDEFRRAYDWLVSEMKVRVGEPPEGVRYPIWAWYLLSGKNVKPDLRRTEFRGFVGENYVLEAEIPDQSVLLSDEIEWHFVLNNWYFPYAPDDDEEAIESEDEWFDGLPPQEQERVKRESWKGVFDEARCPWNFVQATFWELQKDQIVSVRKFHGRSRADVRTVTTRNSG